MPSSNFPLAIFLALVACLGLGLIGPMGAEMGRSAGSDKMHPASLFLWGALGFFAAFVVINVVTGFEPLKTWKWHWSGWVTFISWPVGAAALAYALYLSPEKASIISAIAATYTALVTAPMLWYFWGEEMPLQKIIGIVITTLGVLVLVLA